ncbi:hypothetical protein ACIBCN_04170 [Nocardia sp. NPDC051052]|uniref:hypothetical protein n=1 Tax=Nocardia sp. NPDC051052 TaxID=3364322 RepID=UPI0037A0C21D
MAMQPHAGAVARSVREATVTIGRSMLGPDTREPLPVACAGILGRAAQDGKLAVSDRAAVDALLAEFLQAKESGAASAEVVQFVGLLREFLTGGKRLRPLLLPRSRKTIARLVRMG